MVVWDDSMNADDWPAVDAKALSRFVSRAGMLAGVVGPVDVLLASDATLRRMNRSFRGKNKTTDVLSFPAADFGGGDAAGGDLAISVETAARQAGEHGHDVAVELRVLVLHGVLHLAGHDHEADSGEMRALEAELRSRLKLPGGLIERAEKQKQIPPLRCGMTAKGRAGKKSAGQIPPLRCGMTGKKNELRYGMTIKNKAAAKKKAAKR